MGKLAIVGGGAAGMMASVHAASCGIETHVFEKNEKLGKKLYLTGKGRCNLTNAASPDVFFQNVVTNPKFLYSSFSSFTNEDVMDFFVRAGLTLKVERGGRVFPASDHSSDVIAALKRKMDETGVLVHLRTAVRDVVCKDGALAGIRLEDGTDFPCDACIVATGGLSYGSTGSTGDGYRFAKCAGHRVTECTPSLVPMVVREAYVKELQGLSLKNVSFSIYRGRRCLYDAFGEMLFTHFGVSGPLVLSASSRVSNALKKGDLAAFIDLKPALSPEKLDARIVREFGENQNRQYRNALGGLLPKKMIPVIVRLSGIAPDKKVNEITRGERKKLAELLKRLPMTVCALRGFNEAIITKGGVSVKEVDPATMESKKIKGLYFAGETLDLDALTGGYNLQIAWSTAHQAARGCRHQLDAAL